MAETTLTCPSGTEYKVADPDSITQAHAQRIQIGSLRALAVAQKFRGLSDEDVDAATRDEQAMDVIRGWTDSDDEDVNAYGDALILAYCGIADASNVLGRRDYAYLTDELHKIDQAATLDFSAEALATDPKAQPADSSNSVTA